jgi:putative ABC transport system ATP-binding protein
MENILSVQNLGKVYKGGGHELTVLEKINFSVEAGSTISIVGLREVAKPRLGLCAALIIFYGDRWVKSHQTR